MSPGSHRVPTPDQQVPLIGDYNAEASSSTPVVDPDMEPLLPGAHDIERPTQSPRAVLSTRRAFFMRSLALLCACSLSVGSHYASYILGPLKSRLRREMGTSNTEFSLLISAFSLNSTWTPLLGGLLASRVGTTFTSILATGVIFLGQILLLIGHISENVRLMALGMFIFGLGLSPLSVVQETIIVRFFKGHGLGVSLALGLVAGKGASFVSARISYPLTEKFGPHAPFYVATGLAGLSVAVNLIYISASKWLVYGAGAELEAADIREEALRGSSYSISEVEALQEVAAKHHVYFRDITRLGDLFWAYVGLNILCGSIWSPFTHLASNIIELRYDLTELEAANQASYLLAGSVILYPICGLVVDRVRNRPIVLQLLMLSSCCTMLCYIWLALPPQWTHTAIPGLWLYAFGHGFSPLLLVLIVPQIVPLRFVSTALGAHKSLEQAGSTTFQTVAGWVLDSKSKNSSPASIQMLLNVFLLLNIAQFLAALAVLALYRKQSKEAERTRSSLLHQKDTNAESLSLALKGVTTEPSSESQWARQSPLPSPTGTPPETPTATSSHSHRNSRANLSHASCPRYLIPVPRQSSNTRRTLRERRIIHRGEVSMVLCCLFIAFTWVLFLGTAWLRLRSKAERGGGESQ